MAGQFEKHVLKVGDDHAKVGHAYAALGQTMDHFGYQIIALAANRELQVAAHDGVNSRNRSKAFLGRWVTGGQYDDSFRAMPINKPLRCVDVNDSAAFDDRYAIAQALGFLH